MHCLRMLRQEDCKLKPRLSNILRPHLERKGGRKEGRKQTRMAFEWASLTCGIWLGSLGFIRTAEGFVLETHVFSKPRSQNGRKCPYSQCLSLLRLRVTKESPPSTLL